MFALEFENQLEVPIETLRIVKYLKALCESILSPGYAPHCVGFVPSPSRGLFVLGQGPLGCAGSAAFAVLQPRTAGVTVGFADRYPGGSRGLPDRWERVIHSCGPVRRSGHGFTPSWGVAPFDRVLRQPLQSLRLGPGPLGCTRAAAPPLALYIAAAAPLRCGWSPTSRARPRRGVALHNHIFCQQSFFFGSGVLVAAAWDRSGRMAGPSLPGSASAGWRAWRTSPSWRTAGLDAPA